MNNRLHTGLASAEIGALHLVSLGPGFEKQITGACRAAIESCSVIVGYDFYLKWIGSWLDGKTLISLPLGQERERAQVAIEHARRGLSVALVSGGDIGVYAMAAAAFEEMGEDDIFDVKVHPGVTAALAGAALLGAPLSHDFATLSLSDLLCPWSWIEERARHLALCDMVVALYNVSSQERRFGVYKILEIFARHKSADTNCGIVRNAYREEQSVLVKPLSALAGEEFDMRTTIIIGNRFSKTKRGWLYTPRGYRGWGETPTKGESPESSAGENEDPLSVSKFIENKELHCRSTDFLDCTWVFSGTGDGNKIASRLKCEGFDIVVSAATQYGSETAERALPSIPVIFGSLGKEKRINLLRDSRAKMIIDATHPFAEQISAQLMEAAKIIEIPYLRFERELSSIDADVHFCNDFEAAALASVRFGKRIFLATGRKNLDVFVTAAKSNNAELFLRITPDEQSLKKALESGIKPANICLMQGPFSEELNFSLWKLWNIDCVVTKESGQSGGYAAKVNAARSLNIPVIAVERPPLTYPEVVSDEDQLVDWVKNKIGEMKFQCKHQ